MAPSASAIITREVVRDDVVHLARDARTLGGGAEAALLVALDFQPRGLLVQRDEQRPALADRDAEHRRPPSPGR